LKGVPFSSGWIRQAPYVARAVAQNLALALPPVRSWVLTRHELTGEEDGGADAYAVYRQHVVVAGRAILELGPGRRLDVLRAALRDGAYRCAAVDIAPYRSAELGVEYHVYDGRALPFADGEFDVVWSWAALEHLRWPEVTIAEVIRVLRPGGSVLARIDLRDHYQLRPGRWRAEPVTVEDATN
jgi:SAM-dependent methyltransferase